MKTNEKFKIFKMELKTEDEAASFYLTKLFS